GGEHRQAALPGVHDEHATRAGLHTQGALQPDLAPALGALQQPPGPHLRAVGARDDEQHVPVHARAASVEITNCTRWSWSDWLIRSNRTPSALPSGRDQCTTAGRTRSRSGRRSIVTTCSPGDRSPPRPCRDIPPPLPSRVLTSSTSGSCPVRTIHAGSCTAQRRSERRCTRDGGQLHSTGSPSTPPEPRVPPTDARSSSSAQLTVTSAPTRSGVPARLRSASAR